MENGKINGARPVFLDALDAIKRRLGLFLALSAGALVPCFWHRRIEAGDLGSHTFNAWLSDLVVHGVAPGLYLAKQWNNILFDLLVSRLGPTLGFSLAEKLVVCCCVLIFGWGAFALAGAASGRPPWVVLPCIWMFAYGWTFQMGFVNFYLSLGLSFFAIALVWSGRRADYALAFGLAALAFVAHPLGFAWLVGAAAYVGVAGRVRGVVRRLLFPAALLVIFAMHFYIAHRYRVFDPIGGLFYRFIGVDQLVLYSHRYRGLALGMLLVFVVVFGFSPEVRSREFWRKARTPLEMCIMLVFGAAMLWAGVALPGYAVGVTFLPERFTSVTAIMLLCAVASLRPRKWHFLAYSLCAVVFFTWLYRDTGRLNNMEEQAQVLASTLPPGARVVEAIYAAPGSRIAAVHLIARPCIGRCFDFTNYEPLSRQFRVRIQGSSPLVTSSGLECAAMREGRYVVREADLPLAEIYQCDERNLTKLCARNLSVGQSTGDQAYRAPWLR